MVDRTVLIGALSFVGIPFVKIETVYCGELCGPVDHECRGHMHVRVLPSDIDDARETVRVLRDFRGIDAEVSPII